MLKAVILLGNPGKQYEQTRHNIAWLTAAGLPGYDRLIWTKKFKGIYTQFPAGQDQPPGQGQWLLKPQVFMNNSGESVVAFMQFFKLTAPQILVVHDDLELDFGTLSFKAGGGLGGHNGLRSVAGLLGRQDFYRFRLGISRPARGSVASYVLTPFSADESYRLDIYLERAAACLARALSLDPQQTVRELQKINTLA